MNQKLITAFTQAARTKVMIRGYVSQKQGTTLATEIITAPFTDDRLIWVRCSHTYGVARLGIMNATLTCATAIDDQTAFTDDRERAAFFSSKQALVTFGEDKSLHPHEFHMMGFWHFALGCLKTEMCNLPGRTLDDVIGRDMYEALSTLIARFEGFIWSLTKIHWSRSFEHALD